jgi:hypothetical protein
MAELHQFPCNLHPPPVFEFIAYDARTITDALMGIDAKDGTRASHWIDPTEYETLVFQMYAVYCERFDLSSVCLREWRLWVFNKGRLVSSCPIRI